MQFFLFLISLLNIVLTKTHLTSRHESNLFEQTLTPYMHKHGSRLNHRSIRDCHQQEFGSSPHELNLAHKSLNLSVPFVKIKRFVKDIGPSFMTRTVRGHYVVISNPLKTLSVLEPDQSGGCSLNIRQTVSETAKKNKCVVAINAGYFDTKQGACLGNVISDGRIAHDSKGIQNAHFGLTEDGQIFTGYVSHEDVLSRKLMQLVGGVVWILRNGTGFVNTSKKLECEDTEETGTMDQFTTILSARSAVGHDNDGNIIFVQVDGKSSVDGINLYEMQTILQNFGVVNAINLDGGGSSTLVVNGTTVNYPYDTCDDGDFACERKVSTILCVHSPYCDPMDCNGHGTCSMGECICDENWFSPKCDQLLCDKNNCSNHGICFSKGCVCHPGYFGKDCSESCHDGWYGNNCSKQCSCLNSFGCNSVTGTCLCKSGFTGDKCQDTCLVGFFGENCHFKCQCGSSCYCDPITGACEVSYNASLYKAAKCVAENIIKRKNLVKDNSDERRRWYFTMIVLGTITSICLASFLVLMFCSCACRCRNEQVLCFKRARKQYRKYPLQIPSGFISESSSDNEMYPMQTVRKN